VSKTKSGKDGIMECWKSGKNPIALAPGGQSLRSHSSEGKERKQPFDGFGRLTAGRLRTGSQNTEE